MEDKTSLFRDLARSLRESLDGSDDVDDEKEMEISLYSDDYKAIHGVRPRWDIDVFRRDKSITAAHIKAEREALKKLDDSIYDVPEDEVSHPEDVPDEAPELALRSGMGRRVDESTLLESKDKGEEGEDSLDAQVDKYLVSYESEAKLSKNEGLDFRSMTRRILTEKDEEGTDKDKPAEEPKKLSIEDLDVKSFVADVVRLVDNYDALLEVRNTILRRAVNHLVKNYEGDVAESFKEELLESYGMEIGVTQSEKQDKAEFQAPKAAAAGPAGGGA